MKIKAESLEAAVWGENPEFEVISESPWRVQGKFQTCRVILGHQGRLYEHVRTRTGDYYNGHHENFNDTDLVEVFPYENPVIDYSPTPGVGVVSLNGYQELAAFTAAYPNVGHNPIYPTLGLAGEAGEVAEKVKKVLRDNNGQFDAAAINAIKKELGDVMWYVARLAAELGLSLKDIATGNIAKLNSRKQRDKLHGSGDDR